MMNIKSRTPHIPITYKTYVVRLLLLVIYSHSMVAGGLEEMS